jgi:hypothetical protein
MAAAACPTDFWSQLKPDAEPTTKLWRGLNNDRRDQMSVLKSLTLATAFVLGIATLANAATYHYRYSNQSAANTAAAERFQNEFKNTY